MCGCVGVGVGVCVFVCVCVCRFGCAVVWLCGYVVMGRGDHVVVGRRVEGL